MSPLLPAFQFSASAEAGSRPFQVGDLVVNFGQTARVIEVRESGLILRETGLAVRNPAKWLADPAKTFHAL